MLIAATKGNNSVVLEIPGASNENGAQIQNWGRNDGAWQRWHFESNPSGDGTVSIISNYNDKAFDVPGGDHSANIQVWEKNGFRQQYWKLELYGGYVLANAYTKQPIMSANINYPDHQPVVQVGVGPGGANVGSKPFFNWRLMPDPGTDNYFIQNMASGLVLDVRDSFLDNGAPIHLNDASNSPTQRWKLEPVPGTQRFKIVNVYSGHVLDIPSGTSNTNTGMQLWEANGLPWQEWYVIWDISPDALNSVGCSRSSCSGQCANSYCSNVSSWGPTQNSAGCASTASSLLNSCNGDCIYGPNTSNLGSCLKACSSHAAASFSSCDSSRNQTQNACSYASQACQSSCAACAQP